MKEEAMLGLFSFSAPRTLPYLLPGKIKKYQVRHNQLYPSDGLFNFMNTVYLIEDAGIQEV